MTLPKKTEKEIQKELLEFIRLMDGLAPIGLSYLTHATDEDRELALFYLKPMEKKKWITSIPGHMENQYQITKKGIGILDTMMVESAKRKLVGGHVDEIITKDNVLEMISTLDTVIDVFSNSRTRKNALNNAIDLYNSSWEIAKKSFPKRKDIDLLKLDRVTFAKLLILGTEELTHKREQLVAKSRRLKKIFEELSPKIHHKQSNENIFKSNFNLNSKITQSNLVEGKITEIRAQRDPHYDLLYVNGLSDLQRGKLSIDVFGEDGKKVYGNSFATKLDGSWGPVNEGMLHKIPTQKLTVVLKTHDRTQNLDTQTFEWKGFPDTQPLRISLPDMKKAEPEISIADLISKIEKSLRKAVFGRPEREFDIHKAIEQLLAGTNYEDTYTRDIEGIKFSSRSYKPDFIFEELKLSLEVKFCDDKKDVQKIIEEMNADIQPYKKRFPSIIFVVYDLGFIQNEDEFVSDFHKIPDVRVIIIKQ